MSKSKKLLTFIDTYNSNIKKNKIYLILLFFVCIIINIKKNVYIINPALDNEKKILKKINEKNKYLTFKVIFFESIKTGKTRVITNIVKFPK